MTAESITLRDSNDLGRQLPPHGMQNAPNSAYETLGNTPESFFSTNNDTADERALARDFPTDMYTGLPLPVVPTKLPEKNIGDCDTSYHHHFYLRKHPQLEGNLREQNKLYIPETMTLEEIAGVSVRICRGQILQNATHREVHRRFPYGPRKPISIEEKFETVVKACAGVIPRMAIDIAKPEREDVVFMDNVLYTAMAQPQILIVEKYYYDRPANYRRTILGTFFMKYAAAQNLEHLSPRVIDEFLSTNDVGRRISLGRFILQEGIEVGVSAVQQTYDDLKKEGLVPTQRGSLARVVKKFIHPHRWHVGVDVLSRRFAA